MLRFEESLGDDMLTNITGCSMVPVPGGLCEVGSA